MNYQQWRDLAPFYIAQTLSAEQKRDFEAFLATCSPCQRELEEWRRLASAVWREADAAARQLPPLSADFYAQLNKRPRQASPVGAPAPVRPSPPRQYRKPTRTYVLPLSVAAGLTLVLLIGGFMLALLNRENQRSSLEVAAAVTHSLETQTALADQIAASPSPSFTPQADTGLGLIQPPTATQTLIPSPTVTQPPTAILPPTVRPVLPTPAPLSSPQPFEPIPDEELGLGGPGMGQGGAGGAGGGGGDMGISGGGDEVVEPGPGVPECFVFTSRTPASIYDDPRGDSPILGTLPVGEVVRTLVISETGWYEILLPQTATRPRIWGWVSPTDVETAGACIGLWTPTPVPPSATPSLTFTPAFTRTPVPTPTPANTVTVTAFFVEVYPEPNDALPPLGTAAEDARFLLVSQQTVAGVDWVEIRLPEGGTGWVLAESVALPE